jgi:hypothetical protein
MIVDDRWTQEEEEYREKGLTSIEESRRSGVKEAK